MGGSEETMNIKISPGGLGSQSLERTNDNGFIISTLGSTVIKTDSNLSYRFKYLHKNQFVFQMHKIQMDLKARPNSIRKQKNSLFQNLVKKDFKGF